MLFRTSPFLPHLVIYVNEAGDFGKSQRKGEVRLQMERARDDAQMKGPELAKASREK